MRNLKLIPILTTLLFTAGCTTALIDPAPSEPPTMIPLLPDAPVSNQPGGSVSSPSLEEPADENLVAGPVYLNSADLVILESFPPQYRLLLKGNLPDPCHKLEVVVPAPDAEGIIDVQVFSLADPETICIQVLEPFEESVSLDGFPPGSYQVEVNGKLVGQIEVFAPPDAHSMKGYELYAWRSEGSWWFSLLLGTNRAKSIEEVTDPSVALEELDALMILLSTLPVGEYVSLLPLPGSGVMAFPPQEMLNEIGALCETRGLMCTLSAP
jgi:hypothetical protein